MNSRLPIAAILASFFLHTLFSAPLFLPGKTGTRTDITFLDLSIDAPVVSPRPPAPPVKKVAPKVPPVQKVVVKKSPEPRKAVPPQETVPLTEEVETPPAPEETVEETVAADIPQEPAISPPPQAEPSEFALGMSRGYFNSLGSGKTLLPEVRDYYLTMLGSINRTWWGVEADHRQLRREVLAVVIIARNGFIVDGWIARSSGDPVIDTLVLRTILTAAPFPPLPDDYPSETFQAPIRLVPPFMSGLGTASSMSGNPPI